MAKRVQVVLNQDVRKLGKDGDLVEVAPGYARNYLYPQGVAVPVTPGVLKQVEYRRRKEEERILEERRQADARKVALETIGRFVIKKQAGEEESIFGTVTNGDVADAILESTKQEVDRRDIEVPEINKLGFYKVTVKLHPEVVAVVEIQVTAL
ncbi:50S ribosomal protein L9 [Prochlorothrix hollandica]|uniref:Large ribosomal subunit protein bL9 n=1 Tax=Prochlorothrix hollandica PCC 9006 = CALU 1027 TaxID=317619 RepID=A0A0M2Q0K0_PROHO|nr:50S ribosomal protein L9 [Prochlorothrix hollandica]KKJ00172.1 50S ribosomal protein L9 [Prochlorothrix hollandica PCC 9006 = CALU 1027]